MHIHVNLTAPSYDIQQQTTIIFPNGLEKARKFSLFKVVSET